MVYSHQLDFLATMLAPAYKVGVLTKSGWYDVFSINMVSKAEVELSSDLNSSSNFDNSV